MILAALQSALAIMTVIIEVEDTGKGIAQENLNRIFEPFFTTKPIGKGTGLGLSLSFNIIEKHNGHIDVKSAPGEGTCFRITLPVSQPQGEASDKANHGSI